MRAPPDRISAPFFPRGAEWVNVATLRLDQQLGRPVLIEFWDFCRSNSLRTLGYTRAWHARYAAAGLRVVSVHAGAYPPSQDPALVRAAVARLGIEHAVLIDTDVSDLAATVSGYHRMLSASPQTVSRLPRGLR